MDQPQRSDTLSKGSKNLIIATSSIAGAILLLFIIWVVVRMRKGAALVDILKLRRTESRPIHIADTEEHQIQWEQRYSVRSSRRPSMAYLGLAGRRQRDMPPLPLPATQKPVDRDAYIRNYWKERAKGQQPSTPVDAISSWFAKDSPPSPTQKPEKIYTKGRSAWRQSTATYKSTKSYKSSKLRQTTMAQNPARHSTTTYKSSDSTELQKSPTVSVRDISIAGTEPPTPRSRDEVTRWSWTNASAPPTPKLNLDSKRYSAGSSGKYRPVGAWVDYQMEAIEEDSISPAKSALTNPSKDVSSSGGLRTFFH